MAQPGLSDVLVGLPPIAGPGPRVLVLGSMPGAKSLELQQYYAFVGNSFWPIMERLFGDAECLSYAARKRVNADSTLSHDLTLSNRLNPNDLFIRKIAARRAFVS